MSPSRLAPRFLIAAAGVVALAGCAVADDGPATSQTRDVAAFTRVVNHGSVDVELRVGTPQRVEIHAGEKVIDDVGTDVRDGTLNVTFDHDGIGGGDVVVEATVPRLAGIELTGSGDLSADGIAADALEVRSDGSGDLALAGRAGRLALDTDGSGESDLGDLVAAQARVVSDGSGDAEVHAVERLDAVVDGSGDVRYRGDPTLTERDDGSGSLRHAD